MSHILKTSSFDDYKYKTDGHQMPKEAPPFWFHLGEFFILLQSFGFATDQDCS